MSKDETQLVFSADGDLPTLKVAGNWDWSLLLGEPQNPLLSRILIGAVPTRRWFGAKARSIEALRVIDAVPIGDDVRLAIIEFQFNSGPVETYQVPLAVATGERAQQLLAE